jgi:acyl transferase domain-containing protein
MICSPTGLTAGAHYDPVENNNGPHLFVVSAKTMSGLKQYLYEYLTFCRNAAPDQLPSICYTTCVGREHYRYRFATVVASMEELVRNLEGRIETFFSLSERPVKGIAFAFPGQGSHYQGMAASLASSYPAFKEILSSASSAASKLTGLPILSFLLDSSTEGDAKINDTQASQVSIFVYQYSVGMWLQTLGIVPAGVLGHSLGEITASGLYQKIILFFLSVTFSLQ